MPDRDDLGLELAKRLALRCLEDEGVDERDGATVDLDFLDAAHVFDPEIVAEGDEVLPQLVPAIPGSQSSIGESRQTSNIVLNGGERGIT